MRACLTMGLTAALLIGAAIGAGAQDGPVVADARPEKVLFVGNSHTSRHGGLDWLVTNMVAAQDPERDFMASAQTEGGVTLEYHYRNGTPDRIRNGDFDTVVLQGYIPAAATQSTEPFLDYGRRLHAIVRGAGADTVFFMTWPEGRRDWAELDDFVSAHRELEADLGISVAPAGIAFDMARSERPDLELIQFDQVHATWEGAYLAAATVYATLFGQSPEGLGYTFGVSDEDAAFLQRVAWQAVAEWQSGTATTG